jgi:ribosome-binding protein aMBF1 (putative translation factor)
VFPSRIDYRAEVRHDGRLHTFSVSNLEIPICRACGEKVITEEVDRQINDALRSHLVLLTPEQIRAALARVGMTQKDLAQRLGIAEATVSRWLNETQIQSKSLDTLLRVFFAFPMVRSALPVESRDPHLGAQDITVAGNV